MYSIRLFDHELKLIAALHGAESLSVRAAKNAAGNASYSYPGNADAVGDFQLARNAVVYRGDKPIFAGTITDRDASDNELRISLIGHADRLARMHTPVNWQGWNGMDLADLARDVLRKFRFRRWTTQADFLDAHAMQDVNLTIEPGSVMLGLEPHLGGQRFKAHGWIQFRIDLGPDAFPTGRIVRWSERAGDPTRITIQTRAANTAPDLDNTPWGPELTAVNVGNIAENEVTGVPVADGGQWVDIRVHLYTEDTESPDNQMEPSYYGRTPILDGLEIIWREPSEIEPGVIPASTGIFVRDGQWNRENHLKALRDECEEHGWQFRVRHDERGRKLYLDLAKTFGGDKSGDVLLRHGLNASVVTLRDSDAEYANVLHCWGAGTGIDRLYVMLRDEGAILERGGQEVEADVEFDTTDPQELEQLGQEELARRVAITSQFVVLAHDVDVDLNVGDTVKVADPRSGLVADAEITEYERRFEANGEEYRLALGGATLAGAVEQLMLAQRRRPRQTLAVRPTVPANVTVQGRPGEIRIWWTGRAEQFELEHTTSDDGTGWAPLATTSERYYEHTGLELGSTHWYRLRAVTAGRASDWVMFTGVAKDTIPPAAPTDFSMHGTLEGIGVQFTPPSDEDLAYVEVHLSKTANFVPAAEGDPGEWDGETYTLYDRLAAPTNVGRYDFEPGTTLYGRLVAVDTSGNRSTPTDELSATALEGVDLAPPAPPTLEGATGYVIDLGDGRLDMQVHVEFELPQGAVRALFERRELPNGQWREVGLATQSPFVDRSALQDGKSYEYRAKAESQFGVWSEQYSDTVTATVDGSSAAPGNVTGLTVDFTGRDLLVSWTPVVGAAEYLVQVLSGSTVRRQRYVSGTAFVYTFDQNAQDHGGSPSPQLTVKVWAVNALGNLSPQAAEATATNAPPEKPTVQLSSSLTQLRWEITSPLPPDWERTTITAGSFTTSGRLSNGVIDLKETGFADAATATVQVTLTDAFGQNSQAATETVTARYLTQDDMAGALFNIVPESTDLNGNPKPPTSGALEDLWDNNTSTGASWSSGPVRVTFKFPMMWFFDMVRLWSQTARAHYVEIRNQAGQWVQVTSQENAAAQAWTIRRFTNNRLYAAREVRITFPGSEAVDLRELKFWTVTLADEILAEVLRLTGSMEILNADGSVKLDAQGLKVAMTDGHKIDLTKDGLTMTPQGFQHPGMALTGYMMGFWDKNNVPSIGLGDVREMASQLGSDMEYGILIAQGEIRASQAVLEASLTDLGVTRDKLGPGSVDREKLSPGAVGEQQIQERGIGISRLGEQIQVPLLVKDNMNVLRMEDTSFVQIYSQTAGTWYDIGSALTFPKTDRSRGLLAEALKVVLNVQTRDSADRKAIRLRVNNQTVAEWPYGSFEDYSAYRIVAYVDARSLPADGQVTVQWQWRSSLSGRLIESTLRQVFQNDQLPLRWGAPQYTLEEGTPSGCFGGCQVSCQAACQVTCESGCEISCQSTCESACQTSCQQSCQSTCETTSQGGGGCIREGTPITIWDPDIQAYREVPVEQLQPGMILPGYNPETDTLEHGELIRLEDAKFSNRFLRIHTDNGPSVDVTYTQPFDVLADMGDGWRWYRLHAKFLKPGMKLVRPFEEGERRFSTITQVEHAREHMVHFWNPKVSNDRYLAAGYADWITK